MSIPELVRPQARAVRFAPDPLDYALISFDVLAPTFRPDLVALIYDEAPLNGCGLIVQDHPQLVAETRCLVKVGRMDPVAAQIIWTKVIRPRLLQVGLHYLE